MSSRQYKNALKAIEKDGILLAFPIKNRPEYPSIWSRLYPKSKMVWDWDEGDERVYELWHTRAALSASGDVVYAKWFRDRATFFSKEIYQHLLTVSQPENNEWDLSQEAQQILDVLESNSPISTKEIKKTTALKGKFMSSTYQRAMRELFRKFLIVGYGEVDDGAFPSLAVGATSLLFEELWLEAKNTNKSKSKNKIKTKFKKTNPYLQYFEKTNNQIYS